MFQINEERETTTPKHGASRQRSSRKKSVQEETLDEQLRDTLVRVQQLVSSSPEPSEQLSAQCNELSDLVKSVAAVPGSSSRGQEVAAALQVLLKEAVPGVAPLVSQMLLVLARVNRQHDLSQRIQQIHHDYRLRPGGVRGGRPPGIHQPGHTPA